VVTMMLQLESVPSDGYFALPVAVQPPIEFLHAIDELLAWMHKEFPEFDACAVKHVKHTVNSEHRQIRFEFMWTNVHGSTRVRAAVVSTDRPVFRTNVRGEWAKHEDAEAVEPHTVVP